LPIGLPRRPLKIESPTATANSREGAHLIALKPIRRTSMNYESIKSVMITGANAGLGKEIARQIALEKGVETIYLACRSEQKALTAKRELEAATGRSIFKIVTVDVADLASVRTLLDSVRSPIDALIMNAGGSGGTTPMALTRDGVSYIFAQNVLGHAALLEGMLASGKLTKAALYLGSEGARGVPKMGIKRPALPTSSVEEFADIATGAAYRDKKLDVFSVYGAVKYVGVLWMANVARQYPGIRLLSVSPGGTQGTEAANSLPAGMRFFYNRVYMPVLAPVFGLAHSLHTGAKRIVDGLVDTALMSGHFYGSRAKTLTGPLVDQSEIFSDIGNTAVQRNAAEAVHRFIKAQR
jgi:NAD(P)-dependent dehydrogenase (short-subunit alcohol dehydrogenase family)